MSGNPHVISSPAWWCLISYYIRRQNIPFPAFSSLDTSCKSPLQLHLITKAHNHPFPEAAEAPHKESNSTYTSHHHKHTTSSLPRPNNLLPHSTNIHIHRRPRNPHRRNPPPPSHSQPLPTNHHLQSRRYRCRHRSPDSRSSITKPINTHRCR